MSFLAGHDGRLKGFSTMAVATKSRSARSVRSATPKVTFLVLNGETNNFDPDHPTDFPEDLCFPFDNNSVRGEYDTLEEAVQKAMDDNATFLACGVDSVWSYVMVKPVAQAVA